MELKSVALLPRKRLRSSNAWPAGERCSEGRGISSNEEDSSGTLHNGVRINEIAFWNAHFGIEQM